MTQAGGMRGCSAGLHNLLESFQTFARGRHLSTLTQGWLCPPSSKWKPTRSEEHFVSQKLLCGSMHDCLDNKNVECVSFGVVFLS
jgi:hypothetical protein